MRSMCDPVQARARSFRSRYRSAANEPAARPLLGPAAIETTASNSETILIVEDEPDVREMLKLLLDGEGYRTVTAADGGAALALAARGSAPPDLVLADYNLPNGPNGLAGRREPAADVWSRYPGDHPQWRHLHRTVARDRRPGPRAPRQAGDGSGADPADRAVADRPATSGASPTIAHPRFSWSTTTGPCAKRCAICSRRTAGPSRPTIAARRSSTPTVPAGRVAWWSMPACPAWAGLSCCSG